MHAHAHHHHALAEEGSQAGRILGAAMIATLVLVLVEFGAGAVGHSMALISDAVHNLADIPTILISWVAAKWMERQPTPQKTYGYHRSGILAAFVNALLLILVAAYILFESYVRLRNPAPVEALLMVWVSLFALAVNGGITLSLARHGRDLNLRSILIHNLGDALSNLAIIAGALLIQWKGITWVDPLIGMAIGVMVLWSAIGILRETSHILLEGLPRDLQLEDVARAILSVGGVQEVHDIHVWTLGTHLQALSCHVRIPDMHMDESERILRSIREKLGENFHITHTTIQFERAGLPSEAGYFMPQPLGRPKRQS